MKNFADSDSVRRKRSLEVFEKTTKVFLHPRCLNCHPAGDRPSQGRDMHVHTMNVKRGKENHGAVAMKCATCHQNNNNNNNNDELVGWGWNPGDNRGPAPYSQKEFGEMFKEWVDTGAECPPL
jgi:hypothetical protein